MQRRVDLIYRSRPTFPAEFRFVPHASDVPLLRWIRKAWGVEPTGGCPNDSSLAKGASNYF